MELLRKIRKRYVAIGITLIILLCMLTDFLPVTLNLKLFHNDFTSSYNVEYPAWFCDTLLMYILIFLLSIGAQEKTDDLISGIVYKAVQWGVLLCMFDLIYFGTTENTAYLVFRTLALLSSIVYMIIMIVL